MTQLDVEIGFKRARKNSSGTCPRIITDNGPQFIAKDSKEFIRLAGADPCQDLTLLSSEHGKIERWHQSFKSTIFDQAARLPGRTALDLSSASLTIIIQCGYTRPSAMLLRPIGLPDLEIFSERGRKLELARHNRKIKRQFLTESIVALSS
jgi:putative transposase